MKSNTSKSNKPMTNYNERLDEVLQGELVCISNDPHAYVAGIEDTKQAITSLFKELVSEARIDELSQLLDELHRLAYEPGDDEYSYYLERLAELQSSQKDQL